METVSSVSVTPMAPRIKYFKRYRMEVSLDRPLPSIRGLADFAWAGWSDRLLDAHAQAKYLSFRDETDSLIFPSLGHPAGCRDLMCAIRCRAGFCPQATWLVCAPGGEPAGTVQGLWDRPGVGAIQNLGVVPAYRGQGLGSALLARALAGFRAAGAKHVILEVTAQNVPAVRLYRAFGFRSRRTIYKSATIPDPIPVGSGI